MRKNLSIALTLLALMAAAPLLGACHATAGAGQDISATGHVLTNSAQKKHAVTLRPRRESRCWLTAIGGAKDRWKM